MPRSRAEDRRGQVPDLLGIHVPAPRANERVLPGHWEGDLIKGAANRSAVGVLLDRPPSQQPPARHPWLLLAHQRLPGHVLDKLHQPHSSIQSISVALAT